MHFTLEDFWFHIHLFKFHFWLVGFFFPIFISFELLLLSCLRGEYFKIVERKEDYNDKYNSCMCNCACWESAKHRNSRTIVRFTQFSIHFFSSFCVFLIFVSHSKQKPILFKHIILVMISVMVQLKNWLFLLI